MSDDETITIKSSPRDTPQSQKNLSPTQGLLLRDIDLPQVRLAVPEDLTESEKVSPVLRNSLAPSRHHLEIPPHLPADDVDWDELRRFAVLTWGEKVIHAFVELIRKISQQWITHVLLVLVLLIYTAIGGFLFHYVEGPHEILVKRNLNDTRLKLVRTLWDSCKLQDEALWYKTFHEVIKDYENEIISFPTAVDPELKWNYIGALFFSGTVYTTIAMADEDSACQWWTQLIRDVRRVSRDVCSDCGFTGTDWFRSLAFRSTAALVTAVALCFVGGVFFRIIEGWHEVRVKCGVQRTRHELINELWESASYLESDVWRTLARDRLKEFEAAVHHARDVGVTSQSTKRVWSFSGALYYVVTVVTTIGYGNVVPSTDYGRALTVVYAFIGIPLILMVLTDLGKMFTRTIKIVWSFGRRFYYTGSCKRIRTSAPIQAVHKLMPGHDESSPLESTEHSQPKPFVVDENFDLPVSIALILLLAYILLGALMMVQWENDWSYFHAVYFIFVSLTTIGFGDMVPNNPTYLLITFIYLLFGLALTSMCINVVQVSITNTFTNAKNKLALRIGLSPSTYEVQGSIPSHEELAPIHGINLKNKTE